MDLLLEDIKTTLGAGEVSLPAVTSGEHEQDKATVSEAEEQALTDAVRSLHVAERESGGVILSPNPMQPSSSLSQFVSWIGVVEAAC